MPHPFLLFGLLAAKKAVAYAAYKAGQRYGWPRVYRRVLEYNRAITPLSQQAYVRGVVKSAFHAPEKMAEALKDNLVFQLAMKMVENPPGDISKYPAAARAAFSALIHTIGERTAITQLGDVFSKSFSQWQGGASKGRSGPLA